MNNTPSGPLSKNVTIEDRQGIEALFNAADDAWRRGHGSADDAV